MLYFTDKFRAKHLKIDQSGSRVEFWVWTKSSGLALGDVGVVLGSLHYVSLSNAGVEPNNISCTCELFWVFYTIGGDDFEYGTC